MERERSVIKISKSKQRGLRFYCLFDSAMKIGTDFGGKSDFYRYVFLSVFSFVDGFEFKVLRQTRRVCLNPKLNVEFVWDFRKLGSFERPEKRSKNSFAFRSLVNERMQKFRKLTRWVA